MALFAAPGMAAIINPYYTSGSFGTAVANGDSNSGNQAYTSGVTEQFNGTTGLLNIVLTGSTIGRGVQLTNYADVVDQNPLQTTTISRPGLSGGMRAFGANWDLSPGGAGTNVLVTINFQGGGSQQLTYVLGSGGNLPAGGAFFFGFTSDTAFTSVTLSAANPDTVFALSESYTFDNLTTASAPGGVTPTEGQVPEPATFGMMGAALLGLGLFRKARR